jgi:hypothetical protein
VVVDHERAWHYLAQFVASKPHHGSTALLAEMQRILTLPDVQVPEGGMARSLRLYGVEVEKADRRDSDVPPAAAGGSSPGGMVDRRDHEMTRGGHDGRAVQGGGSPHREAGGSGVRAAA